MSFLVLKSGLVIAQTNHSITIGDATNDFNAAEALGTESSFTAYLTWDATNIYIGVEGANAMVGTFTNLWVVIDTDPATANDPRSGNGLNTQPDNQSGGADYPFFADEIFEFYGAMMSDGITQSPAPGEKWTVSGGAWNTAAQTNTQIRRHATDITDLIIPFSETSITSGSDFNIIIYLANTGTSGTDNNYAQWPTNNQDVHAPNDANGTELTHYFTFTRTTGISTGDDRY